MVITFADDIKVGTINVDKVHLGEHLVWIRPDPNVTIFWTYVEPDPAQNIGVKVKAEFLGNNKVTEIDFNSPGLGDNTDTVFLTSGNFYTHIYD